MIQVLKKISSFYLICLTCVILTVLNTSVFADSDSGLVINDLMSSNTLVLDEDGDSSDWIELFNGSNQTINLSNYKLTDDPANLSKWSFPAYELESGEYLLIFASGKDRITANPYFHTNFRISDDDPSIILTNSGGTMTDMVELRPIPRNISFGRTSDGTFRFFTVLTPGEHNYSMPLAPTPVYSQQGGFYTGSVSITLSTEDPNAQIFYTLDGRTPTTNSSRYNSAIHLNQTTTIRSIATRDGYVNSAPAGQTYFINFDRQGMGVLSVSIEDEYLWDPELGIFPSEGDTPDDPPNRQRNQSRPVHFEYFNEDGQQVVSMGGDIQVVGNSSRDEWMRPFKLSGTDDGLDVLHSHVEGNVLDTGYTSYRHIQLRNGNQDAIKTVYYDPFFKPTFIRNTLFSHTVRNVDHFELRDVKGSTLVIINGFNFGFMDLGEKRDNSLIEIKNPEVSDDDVDLIIIRDNQFEPILDRDDNQLVMWDFFGIGIAEYEEVSESARLSGGTQGIQDFFDLINYLQTHNLNNSANYEYVKRHLNIESYLTGVTAQIIAGNIDFSTNNVGYWRNAPVGEEPGPFHMINHDFDATFGLTDDSLRFNTLPVVYSNSKFLSPLLSSNVFKNAFIRKFDELLNGPFQTSNTLSIVETAKNKITPWVNHQIDMWGNGAMSYGDWVNNVEHLKTFLIHRPDDMRHFVSDFFNLGGTTQININVNDSDGGKVYMEHITRAELPASGQYFNSTPLTLSAQNERGYRFVKFQIGTTSITEPRYTFTPSGGSLTIDVIFEQDDDAPVAELAINEIVNGGNKKIIDEDGDSSDWIEIYNTTSEPINLNGKYLSDDESNLTKWQFPDFLIAANSYQIIYCSGKNKRDPNFNLHTSFKLSTEPVYLTDTGGSENDILDFISLTMINEIEEDHSAGKFPDGSNTFINFDVSTPGLPNYFEEPAEPGIILSPAPNSTLESSSVNFVWSEGSQADRFTLNIDRNFFRLNQRTGSFIYSYEGTETTTVVNNLPQDGADIYARLWTLIDGQWIKGDLITYHTEDQSGIIIPENATEVTPLNIENKVFVKQNEFENIKQVNTRQISSNPSNLLEDFLSSTEPESSISFNYQHTESINKLQAKKTNIFNEYRININELVAVILKNKALFNSDHINKVYVDIASGKSSLKNRGDGDIYSGNLDSESVQKEIFKLPDVDSNVFVRIWSRIGNEWEAGNIISADELIK